MKCHRIGRDPNANDIVVSDPTDTVSRCHAELTLARDGRLFFSDLDSSNGSFRAEGALWVPLERDYVGEGETLKLGEYETTVAALLRLLPVQPAPQPAPAAAPASAPASAPGPSTAPRPTAPETEPEPASEIAPETAQGEVYYDVNTGGYVSVSKDDGQ